MNKQTLDQAQSESELAVCEARDLSRMVVRLTAQVKETEEELRRTRRELRALAASLLTSQEEERRRVARELHDDVSQHLAVLANEIEQLRQKSGGRNHTFQAGLEQLRQHAAALSENIRQISHALHPSLLEDLGLPAALRSLVNEFSEREGMPADFTHRSVPARLPAEVAGNLYRIAQEALRNVAKHAGRTHVKVSLIGTDSVLQLNVRDLGEGFDPTDGRGLGLISMEERACLLGGKFHVNSALGEGTSVQVIVPLDTGPAERRG